MLKNHKVVSGWFCSYFVSLHGFSCDEDKGSKVISQTTFPFTPLKRSQRRVNIFVPINLRLWKWGGCVAKGSVGGGEGVNETGRAQGSREKRKAQPAGPVWPGMLVAGAM